MLLQLAPTPTGQLPTVDQFTGMNLSLTQVTNIIAKQYGALIATKFLAWWAGAHKQDPALTPAQGAVVFITGSTIATNLGGVANAEAQIPAAAAKGANSVYQDLLGKFNLGNWFLRIGEILLGLVLVGVGLARVTGTQNVISNIVKTKVPI